MTSAPSQARAFWIAAPGRGEIRDEPLAPPGPDDVLVRTLFTGISRGTEATVFSGRVPRSEFARMRAPFQSGSFPAPLKYGYCNVGVVEQGPAALIGSRVFSLYPHQNRFVVSSSAVTVVPDDVPSERAVLAANLETAITGIWDGHVQPGDRVAIVGAGTVGCLVAWLAARIPGCEVTLVDINHARAAVSATLGAAFADPATAPVERDVVFHTSGSPEGLALALRLAGRETPIVEMSWYGDRSVTLPLGEGFHSQRLRIVSSQVGTIPASHRARWDHRRRLALALDLLTDPQLDVLVTGESAFDELPAVMRELASGTRDALCHRIRY